MSLVMSMRCIFGDDWNDAPSSSRFWYNFSWIEALDFRVFTHAYLQIIEYESKYAEEYSTVDKEGSKSLSEEIVFHEELILSSFLI